MDVVNTKLTNVSDTELLLMGIVPETVSKSGGFT